MVAAGDERAPDYFGQTAGRVLHFAGLALDVVGMQLRRGNVEVVLRPKSLDVLVYLATRPGRLVSKPELLAALWPGVTVTDDSLVQCLVDIRRALGDHHDVVCTVRGRGYRFNAEVVVQGKERAAPEEARLDATPSAEGTALRASRTVRRFGRVATATLATAAVVGCGLWTVGRGPVGARRADGTRGSVFGPAGGAATPLVRPIGAATVHASAADAYAAGEHLFALHTRAGLLAATSRFEEAIAADPEYAAAWTGLSKALTLLHIFGAAEPAATLPRARQAAARAVELDPTFADAYSALAHVQEQWDRDWAAADASHRRALALNPQSARHRQLYALFLVTQQRHAEARAEADRAIELAPTHAPMRATRGVLELLAGRPEAAVDACDDALRLDTGSSLAAFWKSIALMELGRLDEALTWAIASGDAAGNEPTSLVGVVHARAGRRDEALMVRRALEEKARVTYVPATEFALIDAALGDIDSALDWFERGFEERSRWMAAVASAPFWRPLHGHPRYVRLIERLALPVPQT